MIQFQVFLTPLLATVLQLKEQFEQRLPTIKFYTLLTEVLMSNNINLHRCIFLLNSFQIFSAQIGFTKKLSWDHGSLNKILP